jgi:hypothetical protein
MRCILHHHLAIPKALLLPVNKNNVFGGVRVGVEARFQESQARTVIESSLGRLDILLQALVGSIGESEIAA